MRILKILSAVTAAAIISAMIPFSAYAVSNEQYIYNFLTTKIGFNTAAACGVLANIEKESDFNPDLKEYGYTWDEGCGYGICQWTNYPRASGKGNRTDLVNWCNSNGYDYKSLEGQLQFLKYHLNTSYHYNRVTKKLLQLPNTADGTYQAGYIWCYYYEIPAGYNTGVSEARGNYAVNNYWYKYSGQTRPTGQYKVTADPYLNIRKEPSTSSSIIGTLPLNTVVNVTQISDDWAKITYNGVTGWCSMGYLTLVQAVTTTTATTTATTTTTTTTVPKKLGTYKVYDVSTYLNVRSGPGADYSTVGKLYGDDIVTVTDISGNWAEIQKDSLVGWASLDYLQFISSTTTAATTTTTTPATTTTTKATTSTSTTTYPSELPALPGDVDSNCVVNLADVRQLMAHIASDDLLLGAKLKNCDVDQDGTVTLADVRLLVSMIASGEVKTIKPVSH